MLTTQDAARRTQARLQRIQTEIDAGVRALQPTLDTAAGQQQLAEFLSAKAQEAKMVVSDAGVGQ
jgi:Domain of unknown function (DUF4226)